MKKFTGLMAVLVMGLFSMSANAQTLQAGQALMAGQDLYSSNGAYRLSMQSSDGHLVLYRTIDNLVLWYTGALGGAGALMQQDRNFVVYADMTNAASAVWSSQTSAPVWDTAAYLYLGNDGTLKIYSGTGQTVWTAGGDPCPPAGRQQTYMVCASYGTPWQYNMFVQACSYFDAQRYGRVGGC